MRPTSPSAIAPTTVELTRNDTTVTHSASSPRNSGPRSGAAELPGSPRGGKKAWPRRSNKPRSAGLLPIFEWPKSCRVQVLPLPGPPKLAGWMNPGKRSSPSDTSSWPAALTGPGSPRRPLGWTPATVGIAEALLTGVTPTVKAQREITRASPRRVGTAHLPDQFRLAHGGRDTLPGLCPEPPAENASPGQLSLLAACLDERDRSVLAFARDHHLRGRVGA